MNLSDEDRLAFAEASKELHNAYGEGLREAMDIPADWKFIDSPKIATEDFDIIMDAVGDAPVRFVIASEGPYSDEPTKRWTRYTAFYSPQAIENIKAWYLEKQQIKED